MLIYDSDCSSEIALEEGEKLLKLLEPSFRVEPLKQREATVGAIHRALASNQHDIIHFAGHANTFYNEMGVQYVANVEIPSEASVDDLQGKLQNSLGQDILQGIRFIEVESTGNE